MTKIMFVWNLGSYNVFAAQAETVTEARTNLSAAMANVRKGESRPLSHYIQRIWIEDPICCSVYLGDDDHHDSYGEPIFFPDENEEEESAEEGEDGSS